MTACSEVRTPCKSCRTTTLSLMGPIIFLHVTYRMTSACWPKNRTFTNRFSALTDNAPSSHRTLAGLVIDACSLNLRHPEWCQVAPRAEFLESCQVSLAFFRQSRQLS